MKQLPDDDCESVATEVLSIDQLILLNSETVGMNREDSSVIALFVCVRVCVCGSGTVLSPMALSFGIIISNPC